jgi:hypothetical protein
MFPKVPNYGQYFELIQTGAGKRKGLHGKACFLHDPVKEDRVDVPLDIARANEKRVVALRLFLNVPKLREKSVSRRPNPVTNGEEAAP